MRSAYFSVSVGGVSNGGVSVVAGGTTSELTVGVGRASSPLISPTVSPLLIAYDAGLRRDRSDKNPTITRTTTSTLVTI